MFDAIEDIPTQVLIDELQSRGKFVVKSHEAVMTYRIWNDNDANDSFEVKAENPYDAALAALDELGWCVSTEPQTAPAPYVVLYIVADETIEPQVFKCMAENDEHAEEQCRDAYPDCDVVWVIEGADADHALHDYWGFTNPT